MTKKGKWKRRRAVRQIASGPTKQREKKMNNHNRACVEDRGTHTVKCWKSYSGLLTADKYKELSKQPVS